MRDVTKDEASLLFKLYRHKVFGKHHLLVDNLLRGFPPEKQASLEAALAQLERDGIVVGKPTIHGRAVYLPPVLGPDIYVQLRKRYPWLPR